MSTVEPSSRIGVTLDLILKTLIASNGFNDTESKNWEAIARLIPGTTAGQCARRYDELFSTGDGFPFGPFVKTFQFATASSSGYSSMQDSESGSKMNSRPGSAVSKGNKEDREDSSSSKEKSVEKSNSGDQGPVMVIHVCDENKDLKQDFQCPRDLLIKEMKYFAEYLSTDPQRWEEVDISVHCDVQIFDWLMKYVKRGSRDIPESPRLEPSNVISILISSDFLKMETLVDECIRYCHKNMSAIVSTPCNMNCIHDKLVGRISDLFSHNEADEIKDRKDKFKSKLFAKKIEKLFDPKYNNPDSPENATTMYRCNICKKMLTKGLEKMVKCKPSRITIDKRGSLMYCHVRDPTFEINEYILELKTQLKYWRDVYWRLWGTVNFLNCSRCGETIQLLEFGHCKYHPEAPRYDNEQRGVNSCVGTYPCCHQKALRFDPTSQHKGCRVRDHIVTINQTSVSPEADASSSKTPPLNKVYDDLLVHRDAVCIPYQRLTEARENELNIFKNEQYASKHRSDIISASSIMPPSEGEKKAENSHPHPRLQALTVEREVTFDFDDYGLGESDDEIGDDEQPKESVKKPKRLKKSRVTIDPQAILLDAPGFEQTKKSTWDTQRSMRYNQDAQRQEDHRRMKEIRIYLTKLRLNPEKIDKPKKEYTSGLYGKLEAQFKLNFTQQQIKQNSQINRYVEAWKRDDYSTLVKKTGNFTSKQRTNPAR